MDSLTETRRHIHTLMRLAYQQDERGVVEDLEERRQDKAVLLSYAIAIRDGLYPEHVEEVRRKEESTKL